MGNSTVTPATTTAAVTSLYPIDTYTNTIPRTSVSIINPDIPSAPIKSPTPSIPVYPPTSTSAADPETSTSPTNLDRFAVPTKSPTAPISWIPIAYSTVHISTTPTIPVTSPNVDISTTPTIPVTSTAADISASPTIPVTSTTFEFPVASPTPTINDLPTTSSDLIPAVSPDSSAVSPTIDLPITPIASPTPTVSAIPINSTTSPTTFHSTASVTVHTSASPAIRIAPLTPVKFTTPLPTEVAHRRTISKISTSSSRLIAEPPKSKSTTLSSAERWDKWNKFEKKQREKSKRSSHTTQQSQSVDTSTPRPSTNTITDQRVTFIIPDIVAVPSFFLRTTAVSNPPDDDHILSERTQSIHTDISIFKYYLTHKETKQTIGNHTKATMFKMNTQLKQTPLPTPSLSFITKNFSDGTHEIDDDSKPKPTFDSLGLQNDLEAESSTKFRSQEKQQRKIHQTSPLSDLRSNSNDSLQFVSSTVFSQTNFSSIEKTAARNNRQPLPSILKKTSSQVISNPYSAQTQEFRESEYEYYPSTVSFSVPSSSKKAKQSISRSEKLFSNRSFHRKN